MEQSQIITFIILINVVLLMLIFGIVIFVFQYRKRKRDHNKEKLGIEKQHKLDLLNTQLRSQDQTMQFIGREIHDSVAQKLTLAAIYTQKLEYDNQFPEIAPKLERISGVINDSLEELRELSRTLTNNRIHKTGLPELLRKESERITDLGICKVMVEAAFDRPISVTVKSFLLRIAQEFMQNSLKHSGAATIRLTLREMEDGLSFFASDNGCGFDTENFQSGGIGLSNMKRRVHLIGGSYKLQSLPGQGTSLHISIPSKKLVEE